MSSYLLLFHVMRLRSSLITSSSVMNGLSALIPSAHIVVAASVISIESLTFSFGGGRGRFKGFQVVSGVLDALSIVERACVLACVAARAQQALGDSLGQVSLKNVTSRASLGEWSSSV